jgi:Uma2 family endonuclease
MTTGVTRTAEGFDRRAFTVREILRMQVAAMISEDENFELIEGEIVPMQAKRHGHELIESALSLGFVRALPDHLWLGVASTMYLSKSTFVEPDLVVYPRGITLEDVKGSDIVLAIEVALTSLKYDRGLKAQIYSRYGVRELWVIDASRRRVHIHTGPRDGVWESVVERGPEDSLICAAIPGFSVKLGPI